MENNNKSFISSLTEPMIALIRDSFQSFDITVKERLGSDNITVILQKQGRGAPSKDYVSIDFIRHRKTSATALDAVSQYTQDEYTTVYQVPYLSTCVILVSGDNADEIAFGLHMRMQVSKNARISFLSKNLAVAELGEITDSDIEEATTSYLKRRRFLVTVRHVVRFVETANFVKRVEFVDTETPDDIIIVEEKQDN